MVCGYGRETRRVTAKTFPLLARLTVDPDLSVRTDGRVLLGDREVGQWWESKDPSSQVFERLEVPQNVAYVRDLGGTLFAWGEWDHRDATRQTSVDDDTTWTTFDVTPRTG